MPKSPNDELEYVTLRVPADLWAEYLRMAGGNKYVRADLARRAFVLALPALREEIITSAVRAAELPEGSADAQEVAHS